jgi:hypothetical protein
MGNRTYIISVVDPSPEQLTRLAERLRDAGFEVTHQLAFTGTIIGRADEAAVDVLRTLPGVGAIEEERTYRLTPPRNDTP